MKESDTHEKCVTLKSVTHITHNFFEKGFEHFCAAPNCLFSPPTKSLRSSPRLQPGLSFLHFYNFFSLFEAIQVGFDPNNFNLG
jgi:hypothetical protein